MSEAFRIFSETKDILESNLKEDNIKIFEDILKNLIEEAKNNSIPESYSFSCFNEEGEEEIASFSATEVIIYIFTTFASLLRFHDFVDVISQYPYEATEDSPFLSLIDRIVDQIEVNELEELIQRTDELFNPSVADGSVGESSLAEGSTTIEEDMRKSADSEGVFSMEGYETNDDEEYPLKDEPEDCPKQNHDCFLENYSPSYSRSPIIPIPQPIVLDRDYIPFEHIGVIHSSADYFLKYPF